MKLISMTDFVLNVKEFYVKYCPSHRTEHVRLVENYANFLNQHLTLGMFVPSDEDGNFLDPVIQGYEPKYPSECYEYDLSKYEKAKEKVLFEGFIVKNRENYFFLEDGDGTWLRVIKNSTSLTVEDLLKMSSVELTPSALKQIGLNPENKIQ